MDTPPAAGAWPAPGHPAAIRTGLVPPLAGGFIIRPETVPGLAGSLEPGATVVLVSASQPERPAGPCGKTQLAAHSAQALWRSGQVDLLAWVDASSRASVLSGYARAAAAAGIEAGGPAEDVAARLAGWLAETSRPWLLVLDDLRDPADLGGLWPDGPAGQVLITTPDGKTVTGGHRARVLPVGGFSTREAMTYLTGRLTDDPDQRHGAIDLAITLGGDPCALAHAAAVIAATTWTCLDYQRRYTSLQERLSAHGGDLVAGPAVTWRLSAEWAGQLSPGGAPQLQLALAALLDGQPVPAPVFTAPATRGYLAETCGPAADPDRAWAAVRVLEHTGLVTIDPAAAPPAVRMPRLVAALARAEMPEQLLTRAARAAADALLQIWPEREPLPWQAADLRSCAAVLQVTAADRLWAADACHPLLARAGHSFDAARLTGPAVSHWARLAATSERVLGPASPHTLAAGSHLARASLAAGQAPEAAAWWQWVITGLTRARGPNHADTLAARVSLGHAMAAAGQPGEAVTMLEQAVAGCEHALGPGHATTFAARDQLAAACQAAGQPAQAIGHYQRILNDHERIDGTGDPVTVNARGKLAAAYLAGGQLKKAISSYQKTLADRKRALGDSHPDTITTSLGLATAYQAAGQVTAALRLHDRACAGYEKILGANHPRTLACRANQAKACLTAGHLTDAATLLRDTVTRCEQNLPAGHPLTQTVRNALTSILAGHTALCPEPGRPSCPSR